MNYNKGKQVGISSLIDLAAKIINFEGEERTKRNGTRMIKEGGKMLLLETMYTHSTTLEMVII